MIPLRKVYTTTDLDRTKTCSKCEQEKDKSLFHIKVASKDGISGWCKQCCSDYHKIHVLNYVRNKNQFPRKYVPTVEYIICKDCGEEKPLQKFPKRVKYEIGRKYLCLKCVYQQNLKRPYFLEARQISAKKITYKITTEEYYDLLKKHAICAICGEKPKGKPLHIDHSHVTGKVRGLLCYRCNVGMGQFGDKKELMEKAIEYLKKHGE